MFIDKNGELDQRSVSVLFWLQETVFQYSGST